MEAAFADFLRLNVAEGDASPNTTRAYFTHARQYATWCKEHGIDPRQVGEDTIADYRRHLVDAGYARDTIALKLAAVQRLYEALAAATWSVAGGAPLPAVSAMLGHSNL